MRKLLLGLVATAAIATPITLATTTPAEAAYNEGCVTKREWQRVDNQTTKDKAHRIFGTTGRRTWGQQDGRWRNQVYEYRACKGFRGELEVMYTNYLYTQNWRDHFGEMNVEHKTRRFSY